MNKAQLRNVKEVFEGWQVFDTSERCKQLRKASKYTMEFEVLRTVEGKLVVQYELTCQEYCKSHGLQWPGPKFECK